MTCLIQSSVVGVGLVASLAWPATAVAQPPVTQQATAIADFSARVTAYVDLTKKVTQGLPPLKRTDDPAEIASREVALAMPSARDVPGHNPGTS